ncbi:hypothetical protein Tsubulata_041521 [Turnera subulata]|uniref:Alpha-galactosidase n=1 Tax=Turnera subulata TaxID=218843 RepID=A0A9Q0FPW8_9ROSI|nr:hypothetical protein Tsubulata_041521 [Turnera subulata]
MIHFSVFCQEAASIPPRGWNSYDSFSWIISEQEFLQSAEIVSQRLKPFGYEYVVVDYLWYRRKVPGANATAHGFDVIDEWGRVIPDPVRWPSSKGGVGFTEVANKVHSMGLKFGIHVMRGISWQAYDANTPILDTKTGGRFTAGGKEWHAQDIGIKERSCGWMQQGFMSVNANLEAGRAFLRSLYEQYAQWGVDFIKNDCVFGDDLDKDQITFVSEVLQSLQRPILYSLSPGTSATPAMAKDVARLTNMYRVTGDDWDTWGDVAAHFDVARDFAAANMIGAQGLRGKSWPDLDMLPLGWLTDPASNEGPHRPSKLTLDEQKTQITLWAIAKSPLMFGGDVRNLDNVTYSLITNPTVLEINSFSSNNAEFPIGGASKTKGSMQQSARYLKKHYVGLTTCNDPNAKGWSIEALGQNHQQICWKKNLGTRKSFCVYSRKHLLAPSDEQLVYGQGELHLSAIGRTDVCLDASPERKLTSKETRGSFFSPCRNHANQMWELNNDGALVSNYSGLCAVVNRAEANFVPNGLRAWRATGRNGETYIAFFNLNSAQTTISANVADMVKTFPVSSGMHLSTSCKYREVWSGREGFSNETIPSMTVPVHGCALFVMNCA